MHFSVTRQSTPPAVRLLLRGELDIATSQHLAEAISAEIGDGHPLIVDLSEVSFLDASCVGILLRGRARASRHRLGYHIVGAQGVARDVLRVCGVIARPA